MNGEDLIYDWRFNVVDEPSEWAFNWEYAEGGTAKPVPREHHATVWMVMNEDDPIRAVNTFFKQAGRNFPIKLKTKNPVGEDAHQYKFTVMHKTTKTALFEGVMDKPVQGQPDPNVGHYVVFRCTTKSGAAMMKNLTLGNLSSGKIAYIPHERVEVRLDDGYRVVSTTGEGPDDEENRSSDLATRFVLFHEENEVARCHMTYEDRSYDPSMGPSIEMIAVKQSRRGEGLAKVLWYWVLRFIEDNFTIECLNNDAPLGHIMVKATQIGTQEVEMRQRKRDKRLVPVGFKEFLYDYCGCSVRIQKGAMGFMFSSRRPKDEEAVLYIPLLSKATLASKRKTDKSKAPKPGSGALRSKCGARMCQWCAGIGVDHLRCSKCEVAFYCNGSCQKEDWKRHKKWCSKTREEVSERMIKDGLMMLEEDGGYSLVMNAPGMMNPFGM